MSFQMQKLQMGSRYASISIKSQEHSSQEVLEDTLLPPWKGTRWQVNLLFTVYSYLSSFVL